MAKLIFPLSPRVCLSHSRRRLATVYDPEVLLGVSSRASWGEINRKFRQQLQGLPAHSARRRALDQAYRTLSRRVNETVSFTPAVKASSPDTLGASVASTAPPTNLPHVSTSQGITLSEVQQEQALLFNFQRELPLQVLGLPPVCTLERATVRYLALGYEISPAERVMYPLRCAKFLNYSLALDTLRNPSDYAGAKQSVVWKLRRAVQVWPQALAERGFHSTSPEEPYLWGTVSGVQSPWVTASLQNQRGIIILVMFCAVLFVAVFNFALAQYRQERAHFEASGAAAASSLASQLKSQAADR
eukprot:RCo053311